MRGVHFLMFLVALPAVAALGHDVYLYYMDQSLGWKFAALGWIWTKYEPESYKAVVEATEPAGYWPYINWLLAQKAFFAGLGLIAIVWGLIGLLWLCGVGRGEKAIRNFTGNRKVDEIMGKKGTNFKYKRK